MGGEKDKPDTGDKGFLSNIAYGLVGRPPGYHVGCPYPPPPGAYPPQGYHPVTDPYGYPPPGHPPYGYPPAGYPSAGPYSGYPPPGGHPPAGYPGAGPYIPPWHGHGFTYMGPLMAGGAAAVAAAYGAHLISHGHHHHGHGMFHGYHHGHGAFHGYHHGYGMFHGHHHGKF